jgi:hypothetical protein
LFIFSDTHIKLNKNKDRSWFYFLAFNVLAVANCPIFFGDITNGAERGGQFNPARSGQFTPVSGG